MENKTFGQLNQGTVINYSNTITADDINFAVIRHYETRWGKCTELLNLETYEKESYAQHLKLDLFWKMVKE